MKSSLKKPSEHDPAEPHIAPKEPSRRRFAVVAAVLALVALAAYTPSLDSSFLNWDDDVYVTDNVHVREGLTWETFTWALRSLDNANWHPLTWLSHALDVSVYGLGRPWGHHLTNLLLHALNTVLLLLALKRLTGRLWPSAIVAALFALHPLHVESVAWVAERKDLLCATFVFLTLWAYGAYAAQPSAKRYLLVALAFAAALAAKPMAVTVPFVLLLLDHWPLKRFSWRSVAEKAPLVAMTAASSFVTFIAQRAGGAVRELEALPAAQRVGNAAYAYVMYLVKAVWPQPGTLVPLYPLSDRGGPEIGLVPAVGLIVVLAVVTVAVLLLWRRKPYLVVGWLIYLGMLVPVIGLVQVGKQIMADRYTYLPLVGVFVALVWLVADWATVRPGRRKLVGVAAGVLLLLLGGLTVGQQRLWRNPVSFWEYNAKAYPNNGVSWDSLASAYWQQAMDPKLIPEQEVNVARSIEAHRKATRAQPEDYKFHSNLADKLFVIGKKLSKSRQIDEAQDHYRRALELEETWYPAQVGLGNIAVLRKRYDEAIGYYRRAVALAPDLAAAHFNLGLAFQGQGNLDAAIEQYKLAIELQPGLANAYHNIAAALYTQGKSDEAKKWKDKALRLELRQK